VIGQVAAGFVVPVTADGEGLLHDPGDTGAATVLAKNCCPARRWYDRRELAFRSG
jgi:hypothetical protein